MSHLKASIRTLLDGVRSRPAVHERLLYWSYGPEFRQWCKSYSCTELANRTLMYDHLIECAGLEGPIDYLEFGVSRGDSMRWWVENNKDPESTFVGFDSFEGIPESWATWPKGSFSADGQTPAIADPRCSFVKGLFHDTLPRWLAGHKFSRRTLVHLDADLYSSTVVVLGQLLPKLKTDDILIFDEFSSYLHEYRAYADLTAAYQRKFSPLCRARGWVHVALTAT
jgi:O-methyltransferase